MARLFLLIIFAYVTAASKPSCDPHCSPSYGRQNSRRIRYQNTMRKLVGTQQKIEKPEIKIPQYRPVVTLGRIRECLPRDCRIATWKGWRACETSERQMQLHAISTCLRGL